MRPSTPVVEESGPALPNPPDTDTATGVDGEMDAAAGAGGATGARDGVERGEAGTGASSDGICDVDHPQVPVPDLRIYAVWQTFPLSRAEHGIDGSLRLLEDSRFTRPGARREGTNALLPPCDPLPSRLEVLAADGHVLSSEEFLPQVDITPYSFGERQTLYEVRELVRCLASCWCGDYSRFVQVRAGRLVPLEVRTGRQRLVAAVVDGCYEGNSVKRAPGGELHLEIIRTEMAEFVSTKEDYWFDGTRWRGLVRPTGERGPFARW